MKLVKGFSLLEVILAMAISISLTAILFQSLSQSNFVLQRIMNASSLNRKMTVVQQLLDREISGIIFPEFSWNDDTYQEDDQLKKEDKVEKESSEVSKNKKEEESKKDQFPLPFEYEFDELGNLKMFTFITTSPISVYGEPQTYMVRVMYSLQSDPEKKGQFILMHQQSENLDPKKFMIESDAIVKKYPVLDGIKSFVVEFLVEKKESKDKDKKDDHQHEKNEKDSNKHKEQEQKNISKIRLLEVLNQWKSVSEEDKENKKNDKNNPEDKSLEKNDNKKLPFFINAKIAIIDSFEKLHTYEYWFAPLYDIQKIISNTSTGVSSKKDQKGDEMAFQDNQSMLHDVRGGAQ